jgi:hypothetical protein
METEYSLRFKFSLIGYKAVSVCQYMYVSLVGLNSKSVTLFVR